MSRIETPKVRRDFASVRVYRLGDPAAVVGNAAVIARELFGMESVDEGERTFSVHPASGYLFFADHGELWQNESGSDLPAGASEVERIARGFLEDAGRKIAGSRAWREGGVGPLFPSDIRPVWLGGAVRKGAHAADHWLCQFVAFLPVDLDRTARVEGAAIDVRIGRGGRIIGLSSRWRPIVGELLSDEIGHEMSERSVSAHGPMEIRKPEPRRIVPPSRPTEEAPGTSHVAHPHASGSVHTSAAGGEEDERREILYWLADENAPQTYLSPAYLVRGGHHGSVTPASVHTLWAEIWQRTTGEGIEAAALVWGGSGSFEYQWASWTPARLSTDGIRGLGSSRMVTLDAELQNVLLGVRDRVTGCVVQVEKTVFPKGA